MDETKPTPPPEQEDNKAAPLPATPEDLKTVPAILKGLAGWNPQGDTAGFSELAQRSLEGVIHLTEYEDDKANRILTAIAFVSAFAGLVFAIVPDKYPPAYVHQVLRQHPAAGWLLVAVYSLFALYAVLLLGGVLLVLHAMRPRFNVPKEWKAGAKAGPPKSFLFYQVILETKPQSWGEAFAQKSLDQLRLEYTKNSIVETYLVAEKIPKKVKPLTQGVSLFLASTLVLLALVVLMTVAFATVPVVSGTNSGEHQQSTSTSHSVGCE